MTIGDGYMLPTQFFTKPDLLNKMVAILKGLMILGEVSIGGIRYALGDATDGSGYCISTVATFYEGEEKVGERLLRVDTGLSSLVALAEKASFDDISLILAHVGLNSENYFNQEDTDGNVNK